MFGIILLVIAVVVMVFSLYILKRVLDVYSFRMRMLKEESEFIRGDILKRFKGRFERLDSMPSFDAMVLHFWEPLGEYESKYPLSNFYSETITHSN